MVVFFPVSINNQNEFPLLSTKIFFVHFEKRVWFCVVWADEALGMARVWLVGGGEGEIHGKLLDDDIEKGD